MVLAAEMFNPQKLDGFLGTLERVPHRKKVLIKNQVLTYLLNDPQTAVAGINYLHGIRHNKIAQELIEDLQPANIVQFMGENGRLARQEDFTADISSLNTARDEIAQSMLVGHLLWPTVALSQAKHNEDRQREICVANNKLTLALAGALYDTDESNKRIKAEKVIYDQLIRPEAPESTFMDVLQITAMYGTPPEIGRVADELFFALHALFSLDLDMQISEKYKDYIRVSTGLVGTQEGIYFVQPAGKTPNLYQTWGSPKHPHKFKFRKAVEEIQKQLAAYAKSSAKNVPMFASLDVPSIVPLATEAARRIFTKAGLLIDLVPTFSWQLIEAPQGRLIFVAGDEFDVHDPETTVKIAAKLREYAHDENARYSGEPLRPEELNNLIEYLNSLVIDPEKVKKAIDYLKPNVTGLYAFGKRGIHNVLSLADEDFLRDMGMTAIDFFQMVEGTRVELKFRKASFTFLLDDSFNPIGLEGLSEENRDWLHLVTLSYLKALRNQDEYQIEYDELPEALQNVEKEVEEEESGSDGKSSEGRIPHLRVMHHGYNAWKMYDPRINHEVERIWKIRLDDLNRLLALIQSDQTELTDVHSTVNELINNHPYGVSVRRTIEKILKRIEGKKTQPKWQTVTVNGDTIYTMLLPTKSKKPINNAGAVFRVTYVPEVTSEDAAPHRTRSNGVAKELKELAGWTF